MLLTSSVPGLLGALVLLVGTTAGANDTPTNEPKSQAESQAERATVSEKPEVERIVVSLPNGRRYVIERPKASGASNASSPSDVVRVLSDGSRISYSIAGGSGGKAVNRRAAPRGRNTSASGVSRATSGVSGGGGGSGSKLASGGRSGGGGGGGGGGATAASPGGMTAGTVGSSSSGTPGAVRGARAPDRNTGSQVNESPAPVPTIGSPRYQDNEATGGQDVTFFDAGISAMVLGRTVYIWGAEIVQSTQSFQLVEGERFAFDGAVARTSSRPTGSGQSLTAAGSQQFHAPLKLEFTPGSTTTLTMFSSAPNPELPDRSIRNWTLRVR